MTAAEPVRLIVLRHAKSAWPDMDDHERPLAPRGHRDAPAAGRLLRELGRLPDFVVCSTARRARETWESATSACGCAAPVVFDPRIYDASAAELLDVVRETPPRVRNLLLIGHQPGLQNLVLGLADDRPADRTTATATATATDPDALSRAREKFPTSAFAILELPAPWSALAPGAAALTHFAVPRGRRL
ncbi:histidine phosphatase family protein [Streptomyces sp. NPDC051976]|uniref:SixA phosphatase family protein n=1 Tax=Streptomyces sp. NPDC051976 TaxID=3154947 RepID=UPI0034390F58